MPGVSCSTQNPGHVANPASSTTAITSSVGPTDGSAAGTGGGLLSGIFRKQCEPGGYMALPSGGGSGAQSMDGLMKGDRREPPTSSSSNVTPAITTWPVRLRTWGVLQKKIHETASQHLRAASLTNGALGSVFSLTPRGRPGHCRRKGGGRGVLPYMFNVFVSQKRMSVLHGIFGKQCELGGRGPRSQAKTAVQHPARA